MTRHGHEASMTANKSLIDFMATVLTLRLKTVLDENVYESSKFHAAISGVVNS